jgi:hypothetical protein
MNCVVLGRKIATASDTEIVKVEVAKIGATATVCVLSPTCAVAQIEQVW